MFHTSFRSYVIAIFVDGACTNKLPAITNKTRKFAVDRSRFLFIFLQMENDRERIHKKPTFLAGFPGPANG